MKYIDDNISDKVTYDSALWLQQNAFVIHKVINNIRFLKYNTKNYTGFNPSAKITRDCQKYILNKYDSIVKKEEPALTSHGDPNLRFDLFVEKERTAIEICLSVLENEIAKDILKSIIDRRVVRLIIIGVNKYYSGKGTAYSAIKTWNRPSTKAIKTMASSMKVPITLVWFDDKGIHQIIGY